MENLQRNIEKRLTADPPKVKFTPPKFSKRPRERTLLLVDEQGDIKTVSWLKIKLFRLLLIVALFISGFLFFLFLQEDENNKDSLNLSHEKKNQIKAAEIKEKISATPEPAVAMVPPITENHPEPEKSGKSENQNIAEVKSPADSEESLNIIQPEPKEDKVIEIISDQYETPLETPPVKSEPPAENLSVKSAEAPIENPPEKDEESPAEKIPVKIAETPVENPPAEKVTVKPEPAKEEPVPKMDVESIEFSHSKPNILTAKFQVKNTNPTGKRVAGHTILVLKTDAGRKRWIAMPDVKLNSGRPSGEESGDVFNIHKYKSVRLSAKIPVAPNRLKAATVFVFDSEGKLLLEKEFPISEIVQ